QVILSPAFLALSETLHERVGEALQVPRGLPDLRVLEDRRVDRDDVVAVLQHRSPPLGFDVVLEQHAVVAVVIGRAEPAVDLRGREDEAAPFAERDDLLHGDVQGRGSLLGGGHGGTVSGCDNPEDLCPSTSTSARTATSSTSSRRRATPRSPGARSAVPRRSGSCTRSPSISRAPVSTTPTTVARRQAPGRTAPAPTNRAAPRPARPRSPPTRSRASRSRRPPRPPTERRSAVDQ